MDTTAGIVVANGRVLTPSEMIQRGAVWIKGERIVEVGERVPDESGNATVIDATDLLVVPGLIDIHVHGGAGFDTMDATTEAIEGMAQFFARHGVTSFLATTMTAGREETLAAIANAARCQQAGTRGAHVLGVHLEGPYISPEQPGAQPVAQIRPADPAEYEQFFAHGNVRLISLAPEIPANLALVSFACEHGVAVAVGHSSASYDEVLAAVRLGLRQACHTFNGMVGLHHRQPGTAGAALTCDEIYAQAIVDLIHLHPAVVKLLVRAKGVERTVLITDAMRAAGLPEGEYDLGGQRVLVRGDEARLKEGGSLAGSTLTLDRALRNVMQATGLSLADALPMATTVPAESIMLGQEVGALKPGYLADLVLMDESLNVRLTMVKGKVVYDPDHRS